MLRRRSLVSLTDWWARLLPRVDEPVPEELFRMTGKLRVIVVLVLMVANYGGALATDYARSAPRPYWVLQGEVFCLGIADIALSAWLWRGALGRRGLQRLTLVCGVLDIALILVALHALGSVNSNMIALAVLAVMVYRLVFTLRIAAATLLALIGGQWLVVGLEIGGVLPAQPMGPGRLDVVYTDAGVHASQMVVLTAVYVLTFLLAHWSVVRLRHRERAVRILRDALHAGGQARVGRHTGRRLRDTYAVGELIAAGGMGEVYRGVHERTGRPIALKLLHPHLLGDARLLQRFRREAEIAGKLGSPHIVEVLDVDRDDEQPFIALELLQGESMAELLDRERALPLADAVAIVDQVARGLTVAREAGVVHRDLKPENIFLVAGDDGQPPTVKILDFGVSKIQGSATAITHEVALLGTPDYMAPEQAVGDARALDHRTDVFALGAISYLAITGRRPFQGASIPAVLRAICDTEPAAASALRPDVPDGVDAVLSIALAKRPSERYADARELARDLRVAISGELGAPVRVRAAALHRATPAPLPPEPGRGAAGVAATAVGAEIAHASTEVGYRPMAGSGDGD